MRALLIHNRYQERGGEDGVFEAEQALLRRCGHEVLTIEFDNHAIPASPSPVQAARLAAGTVWSRAAARRVARAVAEHRPEVVHIHNTFPLASPSVYRAARSAGAAVVQTLHNFRLVCPNALLYRDGHVCEACVGARVPLPGVRHACYHGSRAQTGVIAAMLAVHRARGTYRREVDRYIALTDAARRVFIAGGLPAEKIALKPNFLDPAPEPAAGPGDHFLFAGRIAEYKGVHLLPRAWAKLAAPPPLRIAGDGPELAALQASTRGLRAVQVLGRVSRDEVLAELRGARALIFPSLWYEAFPLTIVEAFACGRPVIASRHGAMAELIEDGRTGLLFTPGDADDLAAKVAWAWEHPAEMQRMGAAARAEFEAKYTAERNYAMLMEIYAQAIEERKRSR